ncbi:NfeD family protein [Microbacterium sp. CFH 31415]|uniref:NfeD family protein n=1 Tax=Microbacterium sp. CFH 31415 TaxID=2921732 RepID=UPI001F14899C|nr:NfeD family protein [Microbacterium sp. CFH 31415]MCH6231701.1 NfeD family protein [Microbacterium sp. CFH 31415]
MLLPFLIVGGVGLVILLISLLLGDIFDHFEIGDGAISGTALGIAAVVFGAAGVLTSTAGLDLVWAYVLAIAFALVAYLLAVVFVRRLTKSSDGVPLSALGLTGVTRSTVSASGGEVSLDGPGEVERRLAYADETIAEGVRIRVVEHSGTRVKVIAD